MSDPSHVQQPAPADLDAGEGIDLRAWWRAIFRRRWLVLGALAVSVVATALVALRQTRIYDAACTIIIDVAPPRILDSQQVQDVAEQGQAGYASSHEFHETQYRVIASRAVAQRAADKLGLAADPSFLGLDAIADPAARAARAAKADAAAALQARLKVDPVKDSRIVRVRVEDPNPERAAILANAVAEAYIAENLAVRSATTQNASDWLEQQLADLEAKLETSGRALFDFKRTRDIVSTSWEDRQSMVSQRLTTINDALTQTRVRKAQMQARAEAVEALLSAVEKGGDEAEALRTISTNSTIQELRLAYLRARAECAEARLPYLENHPKAEACAARMSGAKRNLNEQIRTALAAAREEYQEIVKTERNLLALLNETKSDAFGLNQHEREYVELKRAYENNQRLYDLLLRRLTDTGVTGMLHVSNVRILDRARPSGRPVRPDVPRSLTLAIVFGLLAGVGLALGAEYLDRSLATQEEVEEKLGVTFLGIVPRIEQADGEVAELAVHRHPSCAAAECLRSLRTNLVFMSPDRPLRTILVTSSGPGEGKTTTAISLALTMAASGTRVVLVDADMRRPRVHRIFGSSNQAGLSSAVVGESRLADVVKTTEVPNLSVVPCGPVPPNSAELLHTSAFERLLGEIAAAFDLVIVDSPPVGVVADAAIMATHVDGTLLVVKAGRTSRDLARRAVRQLRDVKANVLGAVLNDLDLQDQRYGQYAYYYRYGYNRGEQGPAA